MDFALDQQMTERVLEKMGLSTKPEPTLQGLRQLFGQWSLKVPFDNLQKRIYRKNPDGLAVPGDSAQDFFSSWLESNTGGTCWAGSNALFALLDALGFRARKVSGNMGARPDLKEPNHGAVVVEAEGRSWLLDPSLMLRRPIELSSDSAAADQHPAEVHRIEASADDAWLVHWSPLHFNHPIPCLIYGAETSPEQAARRAAAALEFSLFNFSTYVRQNTPGEVLGVCFDRRVCIDQTGQKTVTAPDAQALKGFLVDELGYAERVVDQLPSADPLPPRIAELLEPFLDSVGSGPGA